MPLDPTMFDTVEENGRTFVRTKNYSLPNDAQEQDRLDLQHSVYMHLFSDRLALAPLEGKPLRNALDIGAGTGIWTMQFAKEHPTTKVTGIDIVKVSEQGKPSNCHFQVQDAEDEWNYPQPWDYIHGRALFTCFADPSLIIEKAFDSLAPGGYLELQDLVLPWKYATPPPQDSAFARWGNLTIEASIAGERPWNNVVNYARWMREAGFVEVEEHKFFGPTGCWPKDPHEQRVGSWMKLNILQALEGLTLRNMERLGWSAEKCNKLIEEWLEGSPPELLRKTTIETAVNSLPLFRIGPLPKREGRLL